MFVGKPFVQTVDIHNLTEVEEALKEIISTEVRRHLLFIFFSMLNLFFLLFQKLQNIQHYSYFVMSPIMDCNESKPVGLLDYSCGK